MAQHEGNTIYITEADADRIQFTAKNRLQKSSDAKGNARQPREAIPSIQQATGASLMADMGGAPDPDILQAQGNSLPALAIGPPYPPCSTPLEDLEPMEITDLKLDTHHRGKKLIFKRASPVVTLSVRSWCMIQDEAGKETERLEMILHKTKNGDEILELTKSFVLKEPFFTISDDGEPTIRIDHPADLISFTEEFKNSTLEAEKAAKISKTKGNAALKDQELLEAHARYSEGLTIARENGLDELARDIARNRAYVNLLLNQLDDVITDAMASLLKEDDARSKDLDSKALFRAGSAAYSLGEYEQATKFFEQQQRLTPDDKDGKLYLKRIALRLKEQASGSYNFTKMRLNVSAQKPRVDAANFVAKTEVKTSPGKGRGLFAAKDIAEGELIVCEKAFCVVWGHERQTLTGMTYDTRDERIRVSPLGLTKAVVEKVTNTPSQLSKVLNLCSNWTSPDETVVDTFRIHDIIARNAFSPGPQFNPKENVLTASTGVWLHSAYINHSCIPNTTKTFIGDVLLLHATSNIPAGAELTHAYDHSPDYFARQASLERTWGFECDCELCQVEKNEDPEIRKKREELRGEADAFLAREHWANAGRLSITKAKRILKGIEETYGKKEWEGMPKLAAVGLKVWVERATKK